MEDEAVGRHKCFDVIAKAREFVERLKPKMKTTFVQEHPCICGFSFWRVCALEPRLQPRLGSYLMLTTLFPEFCRMMKELT